MSKFQHDSNCYDNNFFLFLHPKTTLKLLNDPTFQKSYTERGKDIHIGRGCQINCRDDPDNGFYCCDGDFCNGATYLTSSLTLVAVLTAFFFLKNILS